MLEPGSILPASPIILALSEGHWTSSQAGFSLPAAPRWHEFRVWRRSIWYDRMGSQDSESKIKAMAPSKSSLTPLKPARDGELGAADRVLAYAADALGALGAALDGEFVRAVDALLAAKGRVIVSGMGKSGHI